MYTPLGIKTDYSLLQSLIKIEDLVSRAKEDGYTCLGILDDNLCASHTFYEVCKKNDIKPIIGLDIVIENYRLFFYPKDFKGLVSLFQMSRDALDTPLTIGALKKYSKDIICVVPYESKDILETIKNIYEDIYVAFKDKEEEKNAKILFSKTIYIKPILALDEESSRYVNYLYMISENLKLGNFVMEDYRGNVLRKEEYNNEEFTNLIHLEFPVGERYIPHFDETIENSGEYLRNLANKGIYKRLGGNVTDEYQKRLNYELSVIENMGFVDYFLIVFDYVKYAIKNGIYVGPGRGSAAGSLVAYSLGITWIDPLKYDLLFERFLNPERITMPDIDVDFEDERIDEVIEYVKNRYGQKRVARIMTFGTMTAKEVLRVVAKINDVDDKILSGLLKHINSHLSLKNNLTDVVKNILARNSLLKKVYDEAFYLEGLKKHISTHAAGVVICSENLDTVIPIIKSGDEYLTGYTMNELESMGLLKMDFLSIRNLTILSNVLKDIEKNMHKHLNINAIPFDDKKVFQLFQAADTVGVFQFESTGMKSFLRRLKAECFDDLVMALAIYRPGPMQNIDTYLERKNKQAKVEYVDDSLKPILESTYGILIYQEQVMEILRFMGNYSYANADIIRRAISKKKLNVIEAERENFKRNAIQLGYSEEIAVKVYDLIVRFADYGFNKSHSVAYAFIAYQLAYLKTHFKEYYYINLLNSNIGGEAKTREYMDEAKKRGMTVLKPDINLSGYKYQTEGAGIRLPLRVIKGVGSVSSDAIIKVRGEKTFEDFFDFMGRCYGFNVNKKTLESLILAGVFDSFGYNRATLLKNIQTAITYAELIKDLDASLVSKPELEITSEFSEIELMNKELELYGFYVSTHPASKYPEYFKQMMVSRFFDKRIETVVLIEQIKSLTTKTGKEMAFITASDETTNNEFVLFPDYMACLKNIKVGDLVKIKGKVEKRYDKFQIVIHHMEKI